MFSEGSNYPLFFSFFVSLFPDPNSNSLTDGGGGQQQHLQNHDLASPSRGAFGASNDHSATGSAASYALASPQHQQGLTNGR